MRKVTLSLITAAVAASATPASANTAENFAGAKIEAVAGFDLIDLPSPIQNASGAVGGINAGYDIDAGGVILGIEGEATLSTASTDFFPPNEIASGRSLYAGVRAGVPVSEKALIYAKAGYANTRLRITDGSGNTIFARNLDGIRGGAGAEYKISDNLHVKGEYRYTNYEANIEGHQAMVGLGIRF